MQGQAPQVETRSVGISTVMAATSELPLNARQSTDLITLSGLAVQTGTAPAYTMNTGVNISVAGSTSYSVQYNLDGASHLDVYTGTGMPLPFPDTLQEFRVVTGGQEASARRPRRRIGQCRDQVRDESSARRSVLVRPRLGSQRTGSVSAEKGRAEAEPIRRRHRRAHPYEQALLLRRISRDHHPAISATGPGIRADRGDEDRRFLCLHRQQLSRRCESRSGSARTRISWPTAGSSCH